MVGPTTHSVSTTVRKLVRLRWPRSSKKLASAPKILSASAQSTSRAASRPIHGRFSETSNSQMAYQSAQAGPTSFRQAGCAVTSESSSRGSGADRRIGASPTCASARQTQQGSCRYLEGCHGEYQSATCYSRGRELRSARLLWPARDGFHEPGQR
jgi:hypothetical protein